jgi:hypothetical protein
LGDADDILLGVVQAVSSKDSDQADVILSLLEYYDIVDQIFVCAGTPPVLTLVYSLEQLCCFAQNLEHSPLVVSLQEAHVGRTHLSLHWVIHWREDQGPQRGRCVKLQKVWPTIKIEEKV